MCEALLETVGPDGTAAVPTFTWGRYHDKEVVTYDVTQDICEVGIIPETFRKLPNAIRSHHVCHSVAAIGPLAEELMGEGTHPFAHGSSMYRLYELDFAYVFLGCGFASCTALHTVEELANVPYRYFRSFKGSTVVRANGSTVPSRSLEFLRYLPFRNDFAKVESVLDDRGALKYGRIGKATIIATSMRRIVDTALQLVSEDPGYLLTEQSREYLASWRGPTGEAR